MIQLSICHLLLAISQGLGQQGPEDAAGHAWVSLGLQVGWLVHRPHHLHSLPQWVETQDGVPQAHPQVSAGHPQPLQHFGLDLFAQQPVLGWHIAGIHALHLLFQQWVGWMGRHRPLCPLALPGLLGRSSAKMGTLVSSDALRLLLPTCCPLLPTATPSLSGFPSHSVFDCFATQHTTIFFFSGGMLSRGEVSCVLGVLASAGRLSFLPSPSPDLGTTQQETMPGGNSKWVETPQGCLHSASSTSWTMRGR